MDKETAVELERLKTKVEKLEEFYKTCRNVIIKTVLWLLAVGTAGVMSGWSLTEGARKSLTDWISK